MDKYKINFIFNNEYKKCIEKNRRNEKILVQLFNNMLVY